MPMPRSLLSLFYVFHCDPGSTAPEDLVDLKTTKAGNIAGIKTQQNLSKDIPKEINTKNKGPVHESKDDDINNEIILKDEEYRKKSLVNPKIVPKRDKIQDYYIPKKIVKSGEESIKEELEQQKSKENMEAVHQLKPPRKEVSRLYSLSGN